jgi:hypothetical protein
MMGVRKFGGYAVSLGGCGGKKGTMVDRGARLAANTLG